jgi:hypothetical protein
LDSTTTVKWLQEVLLQRYWSERCQEDGYFVEARRVLGARMNPAIDRYPDIIENRIEGLDRTVPAEVEWTTNDFRLHNHPLEVLTDNEGFLIVCKKTQAFPVPQVELQMDSFRDWLDQSKKILLDETLEEIETVVKRRNDPRGWIVWRSRSMDRHMEIGLNAGLWGFPNNLNPNRIASAQAMKKGDILIFVGPWKKGAAEAGIRGGRISYDQFLRGMVETVSAYPITKGYFASDEIVWPPRGDETWKHRVAIDSTPVFEGRDVPAGKALLGSHLPDILRRVMVGRSDPLEIPEHLVLSLLSAIGRAR